MNKLFFAPLAICLLFSSGCYDMVSQNEKTEHLPKKELSNSSRKNDADDTSSVALTQEAAGLPHHLPKAELKAKKQLAESFVSPAVAPTPALRAASTDSAYLHPGTALQLNRESYNSVAENIFHNSLHDPLSTFSIDVDTASYANIRRFIAGGSLPPVGAVRIEEMINYFNYTYPEPTDSPFSLSAEVGPSPWHEEYKLVRIGLKGIDIAKENLPPSNLVFLIDVSGSMTAANKLPLLKKSMKMLVKQLDANDRVSIVVYAGSDRVVLQPTSGADKTTIEKAINSLNSGGSTHGSQGIITAYQLAEQTLMPSGNNRIILASDGDFNVGITSRGELQKLIEDKRKTGIYLTVLGFGMNNYHDDTMEILADKGNGNYAYIDSLLEAKKVMVKEMSGTMFALAKDVKVQVEFNPSKIGAYRLLGYENRLLNDEDFTNDQKDAGEIGVGHEVTALYELIPAGHSNIPHIDKLKYQNNTAIESKGSDELLTIKLRYKPLKSNVSTAIEQSVFDSAKSINETSDDYRFAAAVAGYGMLLKKSPHHGSTTLREMMELARGAKGADIWGYRAECIRLMELTEMLL